MNSIKVNGTTIVRDGQWAIARIFIDRSDRSMYGFEVDRMSSAMAANRARSTSLDVEVTIADDGEVVVTPETYRCHVLDTIAEDVEMNAKLARRVRVEGTGHQRYVVSCAYCPEHRAKGFTARGAFLAMAVLESRHRTNIRTGQIAAMKLDARLADHASRKIRTERG